MTSYSIRTWLFLCYVLLKLSLCTKHKRKKEPILRIKGLAFLEETCTYLLSFCVRVLIKEHLVMENVRYLLGHCDIWQDKVSKLTCSACKSLCLHVFLCPPGLVDLFHMCPVSLSPGVLSSLINSQYLTYLCPLTCVIALMLLLVSCTSM